jgi:uncharacterized protein YecT (DUF1311 family)
MKAVYFAVAVTLFALSTTQAYSQTTIELADSAAAESNRTEARLSVVYSRILDSAEASAVDTAISDSYDNEAARSLVEDIKESEKVWLQYRKLMVKAVYDTYGSGTGRLVAPLFFEAELNERRINDLEEMFHQ